MRIFLFGNGDYATHILQTSPEIMGLCTRRESFIRRTYRYWKYGIKPCDEARRRKIPTLYSDELHTSRFEKRLKTLKPDMIIVAGFNLRIPKSIYTITTSINFHPSLLPKYKGGTPIRDALKNKEEYIGVTAHYLDSGWDTGKIILQHKIYVKGDSLEVAEAKASCEMILMLGKIIDE